MRLDQYTVGQYTPGAPYLKQLLWYFLGQPLFRSYWLPVSSLKVRLLRLFGAQVGEGVRVKPGVTLKFPWRIAIGDYVWLGEQVWLDNVINIRIDDHVCISQGAYLGTGNHDWQDPNFALKLSAIHLESRCWIGAKAVVGPGVTIGHGAVLCLGSIAGQSLAPMTIYAGNPARPVKTRKIRKTEFEPVAPSI